jgi:hypothetical protein
MVTGRNQKSSSVNFRHPHHSFDMYSLGVLMYELIHVWCLDATVPFLQRLHDADSTESSEDASKESSDAKVSHNSSDNSVNIITALSLSDATLAAAAKTATAAAKTATHVAKTESAKEQTAKGGSSSSGVSSSSSSASANGSDANKSSSSCSMSANGTHTNPHRALRYCDAQKRPFLTEAQYNVHKISLSELKAESQEQQKWFRQMLSERDPVVTGRAQRVWSALGLPAGMTSHSHDGCTNY